MYMCSAIYMNMLYACVQPVATADLHVCICTCTCTKGVSLSLYTGSQLRYVVNYCQKQLHHLYMPYGSQLGDIMIIWLVHDGYTSPW